MDVSFLADHPHESEKIAQWYYDEWADSGLNFSFEAILENMAEKVASRLDFPLAFIVHEGAELMGVTELKYRENKHYPAYEHWIGGVFVCPNNRNKGYSSALISRAKKHVEDLNINLLYLQCDAEHIALYEKYGFKALHEAEHFGDVTTIMLWQVNP